MSTTTDFLGGVAGLFVTAGIGVYRPAGPDYTATEVGISLTGLPDAPDQAIALAAYQVAGDDPDLPISTPALQVTTRGNTDPRTEMAIRDAIYTLLHGRRHTTLGSVHVIQFRLVSGVPMGPDSAGRYEYRSNYYTVTDMPATANRFLSQ